MKIRTQQKALCSVIVMLVLGVRLAGQSLGLEEAKASLVHANILSTARVGYGATLSDKGWALNYILTRSTNPRKDLAEIFESADSVYGKLYAVIGLLEKTETENKSEDKLLQTLRQQNVKIIVQEGDLVDWIHVGDVVDQLYSPEARKRMFIIDGELKSEGMTKTDGLSFVEMEKAVERETLKAKAKRPQPNAANARPGEK